MLSLFGLELNLLHLATIAALAAFTVVARSFFLLSSKNWVLPGWAQRGLQYAPIGALCAVIAPEVVMSQGHLIHTWQDARLYAVAGAMVYFFLRRGRGQAVLGAIVSGMAVYLPLHIGLGW
ncbi:MAG: AzlD domain-containing protein [Rhodoferax sp.]|nr:AzlD domain-containing protein [Rhodoferax sp.]